MFIYITYKDSPELSPLRKISSEMDLSVEKTLLVNPKCPVRIMLEYIRKKCCLGKFTDFDLCDGNGYMKRLFDMPTYAYATDQFEHKKTYYVVVLKQDGERKPSILPQVNRENNMYEDLKEKIRKFMAAGELSSHTIPSPVNVATGKVSAIISKPALKKK